MQEKSCCVKMKKLKLNKFENVIVTGGYLCVRVRGDYPCYFMGGQRLLVISPGVLVTD